MRTPYSALQRSVIPRVADLMVRDWTNLAKTSGIPVEEWNSTESTRFVVDVVLAGYM